MLARVSSSLAICDLGSRGVLAVAPTRLSLTPSLSLLCYSNTSSLLATLHSSSLQPSLYSSYRQFTFVLSAGVCLSVCRLLSLSPLSSSTYRHYSHTHTTELVSVYVWSRASLLPKTPLILFNNILLIHVILGLRLYFLYRRKKECISLCF